MEFKKCQRCGCFFLSNNDVCTKCEAKDKLEMNNLKNYLENLDLNINNKSKTDLFNNNSTNKNYSNLNSYIDTISVNTGITVKNLNRYFTNDAFVSEANIVNTDYPNFADYVPSNKISTKIVRKHK